MSTNGDATLDSQADSGGKVKRSDHSREMLLERVTGWYLQGFSVDEMHGKLSGLAEDGIKHGVVNPDTEEVYSIPTLFRRQAEARLALCQEESGRINRLLTQAENRAGKAFRESLKTGNIAGMVESIDRTIQTATLLQKGGGGNVNGNGHTEGIEITERIIRVLTSNPGRFDRITGAVREMIESTIEDNEKELIHGKQGEDETEE